MKLMRPRPGTSSEHPTYVAIKGTVFDVSGNSAYAPKGGYHGERGQPARLNPSLTAYSILLVFAGKDASRALAKTSLKAEDCVPEWEDLDEKEIGCMNDWFSFFEQRYNIVGKVHR